jgi:hypothetical protein
MSDGRPRCIGTPPSPAWATAGGRSHAFALPLPACREHSTRLADNDPLLSVSQAPDKKATS